MEYNSLVMVYIGKDIYNRIEIKMKRYSKIMMKYTIYEVKEDVYNEPIYDAVSATSFDFLCN